MIIFPEKMPRRSGTVLSGIASFCIKLIGWKLDGEIPNERKIIVCAAPHTSNWDFIFAALFILKYNIKVSIMMKKEAFFWPMAGVWRWLGFVPTDRKAAHGAVGDAVKLFKNNEQCWLVVTPEGTRAKVKRWKSGFLRIAQQADVPIVLLGIDYATKSLKFGKVIRAQGDINQQLEEIVAYYEQFKGKYD